MSEKSLLPTRTIGFVIDVSAASLRPPPRESAPNVIRERHARKLITAVSRLIAYHKKCSYCRLRWSYRFFDSESQTPSPVSEKDVSRETSEEELETFRHELQKRMNVASVGAASTYAVKYYEIAANLEDGLIEFTLCLPGGDIDNAGIGEKKSTQTTLLHCVGEHPFQPLMYVLATAPDSVNALSACQGAPAFLRSREPHCSAHTPTSKDIQSMISSLRSSAVGSKRVSHTDKFINVAAGMESQNIGLVWLDTRPSIPGVFARERTAAITAFSAWLETLSTSASFIDINTLLFDERLMPVESHIAQIHPDAQISSCTGSNIQGVEETSSVEWSVADVLIPSAFVHTATLRPKKAQARDFSLSPKQYRSLDSSLHSECSPGLSLVRYFRAQLSTNFSQDFGWDFPERQKMVSKPPCHLVIILRGTMSNCTSYEELFSLRAFESSAQVLRSLSHESTMKGNDANVWAGNFTDVMNHLMQTSKGIFADICIRAHESSKTVQPVHSVLIRPLNSSSASVRKVILNADVPRMITGESIAGAHIFRDVDSTLAVPDLSSYHVSEHSLHDEHDRSGGRNREAIRSTELSKKCQEEESTSIPQHKAVRANGSSVMLSPLRRTSTSFRASGSFKEDTIREGRMNEKERAGSPKADVSLQLERKWNCQEGSRHSPRATKQTPNSAEIREASDRSDDIFDSPHQHLSHLTPFFDLDQNVERCQDTELSDFDIDAQASNVPDVCESLVHVSKAIHIPKQDRKVAVAHWTKIPSTPGTAEEQITGRISLAAPSEAHTNHNRNDSCTDDLVTIAPDEPQTPSKLSTGRIDEVNRTVREATASFKMTKKKFSEQTSDLEQHVANNIHKLKEIAQLLSVEENLQMIKNTVIRENLAKDSDIIDALDETQRECKNPETAVGSEATPSIWRSIMDGFGQVIWLIIEYAHSRHRETNCDQPKSLRRIAARVVTVLSSLQLIGEAMASSADPHSLFHKTFTSFFEEVLLQFVRVGDTNLFMKLIQKIFVTYDREIPVVLSNGSGKSSPLPLLNSTPRGRRPRSSRQSSYQQLVRASSDTHEQACQGDLSRRRRKSVRRELVFENERVGEKRSAESFLGREQPKKQYKRQSLDQHKETVANARKGKQIVTSTRRMQIPIGTVELLTRKRARHNSADSKGSAGMNSKREGFVVEPCGERLSGSKLQELDLESRMRHTGKKVSTNHNSIGNSKRDEKEGTLPDPPRPGLRRSPRKNRTSLRPQAEETSSFSPQNVTPKRRTSPRSTRTFKRGSDLSKTSPSAVVPATPIRKKKSKAEVAPDWTTLHQGRLTRGIARRLADVHENGGIPQSPST